MFTISPVLQNVARHHLHILVEGDPLRLEGGCNRIRDAEPKVLKGYRHLGGRERRISLFFCRGVHRRICAELAGSDDFNLVRGAPRHDVGPLGNSAFRDAKRARYGPLTTEMQDYVRFEHTS